VYLAGFIVKRYHDARSPERQISKFLYAEVGTLFNVWATKQLAAPEALILVETVG